MRRRGNQAKGGAGAGRKFHSAFGLDESYQLRRNRSNENQNLKSLFAQNVRARDWSYNKSIITMAKIESDAVLHLPIDSYNDETLQDEMDTMLREKFPSLPAWEYDDLTWFHFTSASDEDHRCLRICTTPFEFPKASFRKCSLALVKAVARALPPSVRELEFGLWNGVEALPSLQIFPPLVEVLDRWSSSAIFPTLVEVLAMFADGIWPASLKVLHLRYWHLGCCTLFVEKLRALPTSLKELYYQSGNGDQVVRCMAHINKFVKHMPNLETLSVAFNWASAGEPANWMLPSLFDGIEKVCTSLADIDITGANVPENLGFNTALVSGSEDDDYAAAIYRAVSNLPMLKNLSFSNCALPTPMVDKILEASLFHTKMEVLCFCQGSGPGDEGIQTLRTYFRRQPCDISLKFLALEFGDRDKEDLDGLEKELETNLGRVANNDDTSSTPEPHAIPVTAPPPPPQPFDGRPRAAYPICRRRVEPKVRDVMVLNRYLMANHQIQSDLRHQCQEAMETDVSE
jgi:hypothetical protein